MSINEKLFGNDASKCVRNQDLIFTTLECQKSESSFQQPEDYLPQIKGWRRAALDDQRAIKRLQTLSGKVSDSLFQRKKIVHFIKTSYFAVVQYDSQGDIVSFTACDTCPNLPSVPFLWKEWLSTNYRLEGISSRNVLFIHYMVWLPELEKHFMFLLLQTIFSEFIFVQHIILLKPPNVEVPEFCKNYFISILPLDTEDLQYNSVQVALLCLRSTIIQPLLIRQALVNDLQAIISVLMKSTNNSKSMNNTKLWELINFIYQKNRRTLICQCNGCIAGIMILSLKIDLEFLNEGFELRPFNGLKKKSSEEDFSSSETSLVHDSPRYQSCKNTNLLVSSEYLFSQMNWELMLKKNGPKERVNKRDSSLSVSSSSSSNISQFSFLKDFSQSDHDKTGSSSASSYIKSLHSSKLGDIHLEIQTSRTRMTHFFPPKRSGQSNAFVIDFFAIDCGKVNEKQSSFDFLEAAFRILPDKEYCILLIPTNLLPFPLMDLFVRVTPRLTSSFNHELYLCHKNSLSVREMSVSKTKKDDLIGVNHFLKNVNEGEFVFDEIRNCCLGKTKHKSFIFTAREEVVGVSLINLRNRRESLTKHFDLAEFVTHEPSLENCLVIKHLIISPLFYNHTRFFVREIMRLVDVNCLYYTYSKPSKASCSLITVLGEFAPVKPKKKVGLNNFLPPIDPLDLHESIPDGLYYLNAQLCAFPKIHLNSIVVIVGASRTGISFLEHLILGSESRFFSHNNIICLTPHSLEMTNEDETLKDLMFPLRDNFSKKYVPLLALETYVNFIYGIMTEINRSEKYIVVNNKTKVKYDYLILTCGLQYLAPTPKRKKKLSSPCNNFIRSSLAQYLPRFSNRQKIHQPRRPSNMFILNTVKDAETAFKILRNLLEKPRVDNEKVILYGHDLNAFLTLNTLLNLGIPGEFMVFVEPFPTESSGVSLFKVPNIDEAVIKSIKESKVAHYSNYFLYDWTLNAENYISNIKFHSRHTQLVLSCFAFFPFTEKLVSDVTFHACNDAGLVYDKKLVINHNFRTNDEFIYAAGPFTKYARRYYASQQNHEFFSSREVGRKLAEIVRGKIYPYQKDITVDQSDVVPLLSDPIILYCHLPGNFNFFVLRKPGKLLDLETAYNFVDYGEVLTTGHCDMRRESGYFRLHLDSEGFVDSIVCYTKKDIDFVNLSMLYRVHERYLNNLLSRFDMTAIRDLFKFFSEPWSAAIFHPKFTSLRNSNFKDFTHRKYFNDETFNQKVVEALKSNNYTTLPKGKTSELEIDYQNSPLPEDIKNNLLEFLDYYRQDLPEYAIPKRVRTLLLEKSNKYGTQNQS